MALWKYQQCIFRSNIIEWLNHSKGIYLQFILNCCLNHTLRTRPDDVWVAADVAGGSAAARSSSGPRGSDAPLRRSTGSPFSRASRLLPSTAPRVSRLSPSSKSAAGTAQKQHMNDVWHINTAAVSTSPVFREKQGDMILSLLRVIFCSQNASAVFKYRNNISNIYLSCFTSVDTCFQRWECQTRVFRGIGTPFLSPTTRWVGVQLSWSYTFGAETENFIYARHRNQVCWRCVG